MVTENVKKKKRVVFLLVSLRSFFCVFFFPQSDTKKVVKLC